MKRKWIFRVDLPATLPPPKDRAGVAYNHGRHRVKARKPAITQRVGAATREGREKASELGPATYPDEPIGRPSEQSQ